MHSPKIVRSKSEQVVDSNLRYLCWLSVCILKLEGWMEDVHNFWPGASSGAQFEGPVNFINYCAKASYYRTCDHGATKFAILCGVEMPI